MTVSATYRALTALVGLWLCFWARASDEYMYGIGSDWTLRQITVDPVANTVSVSNLLSLSSFVSGWGTHSHESINGLGVDPATGRIYFDYTYNANNGNATKAPLTVAPYVIDRVNGVYTTPHPMSAPITSSTLTATTTVGGWLPGGEYFGGSYWATIQNSDSLVKFALDSSGTNISSTTQFSNYDHTSASTLTGGDFVINTNNTVIYGTDSQSSTNFFFRQSLSAATNSSGAAWTNFNVNSTLAFSTAGSIELGGMGQTTNLFVATSTTHSLYLVTNYNSASSPGFSLLGSAGSLGISFVDLSVALTSPLNVPEASTWFGGLAAASGAAAHLLLRRRAGKRRGCGR